nr:RsmE family RNA methyltransferase [Kofleriaceae bacterium]
MTVRVRVAAVIAGELAITGDEHHYLGRVRRVRVGDAVVLVDGAGRVADAQIVAMTDGETRVRAGEPRVEAEPRPRVHALIPWIKGDRMEHCVEKLVEVGCSRVVVWPAERAVVKLTGARLADRARKLAEAAIAAARQCGRAADVEVVAVESLRDAVEAVAGAAARFVLSPTADRATPSSLATLADDVALASGPEGGLAPRELDALVAAGFAPLGLGPRVLRAETAPVVAVALIRAATGS